MSSQGGSTVVRQRKDLCRIGCVICGGTESRIVGYSDHLGRSGGSPVKTAVRSGLARLDSLVPWQWSIFQRPKLIRATLFGGKIRVCLACGYGRKRRMPSEALLAFYYRSFYWSGRGTRDRSLAPAEDGRAVAQAELLQPYLSKDSNAKVLEIGAGAALVGRLVTRLIGAPLSVVEPGSEWEDYYARHDIHRVARFFPFDGEIQYDLVIASHWLEHVVDLERVAAEVARMTKSGGLLFIEVPNATGSYWDLDVSDSPHLHFFSAEAISRLFERYGFETLHQSTAGPFWYQRGKSKSSSRLAGDKVSLRTLFRKERDIREGA